MNADDVKQYIRQGWALVPIPRGLKGPEGHGATGWNLRENCITNEAAALKAAEVGNIGLAHSYSGTCALDLDNIPAARTWLAERGVDLDALLKDPAAVRLSSGRPDRDKLVYKLSKPLASLKLAPFVDAEGNKRKALELRCADRSGKTVQCVLSPSIHPDTGKPYTWVYNDPVAHFSELPELPAELLALWKAELPKDAVETTAPPAERVDIEDVRRALFEHDPSASEDEWHRCLMAVHWETRGSKEGLDLADEWSKQSTKNYTGRKDIASRWRSWKHDIADPITFASLRVRETATKDDLEDVTPLIGAVPRANHLCTDQANAHRIQRHYDGRLMVSAGRFYIWTNTHWEADDGEARRCACYLTEIVKNEALTARAKADKAVKSLDQTLVKAAIDNPRKNALGKTEAGKSAAALDAVANALEKWSVQCESKRTQDAALGILRDLITVDEDNLDRDPWALNCLNGTVDLRTGALRPHNPKDYLTRIVPVDYHPDAKAPRFEAFLNEIMNGDAELVKFLARWFGYCASGDVREQKFVVHIGHGANGKGTLLKAVQAILGEYSTDAPLGLMTRQGDRNDTETAVLFRRRLVTASEPDENAVLSEGFVKQATGGDRLPGRWRYGHPFTFSPTHKLQMLTNSRPQIKGTDFGIWRRVLLLQYPVLFGTAADIAAGRANRLRNDSMDTLLAEEREGILCWLVQGAVAWSQGGLNPPKSIQVANREYQAEQDRVGQFVEECCRLTQDAWTPIGGLEGVYPAYQAWAKGSGYAALGKGKLLSELERIVPGYRREDRFPTRTKLVRGVVGIVLDQAGDL